MNGLLSLSSLDDKGFLKALKKHSVQKHFPKDQMYDSNYNDKQRCYITYEPLNQPELSLFNLVVGSSSSAGSDAQPFQKGIMEDFIDKNIVINARRQGYLDYKYMLYGDKSSLPLSLRVDIKHVGIVQLCEPPGNWGNLPAGFKSFYKDDMAKVYITENVALGNESSATFDFDESRAKQLPIVDLKKGTQFVCAEIGEKINLGNHVLTIVPTSESKIMISYMILP